MELFFDAILDEIEKIAVAKKHSPFLQGRRGRRSVRVSTALKRDDERNKEATPDIDSGDMEREGGMGMDKEGEVAEPLTFRGKLRQKAIKTGIDLKKATGPEKQEKAMRQFVSARPYVKGAVTSAVPGALMGAYALGKKGQTYSSRGAKAGLLLGAGLGLTNEHLKAWAKKNPRNRAAKVLKKSEKEKIGAMAADLRRTGIGGVKRPPFATEDSKRTPGRLLTSSMKPGQYNMGMTQPKHMFKPGPSIKSVATI
jgi:hypothetical protein